MQFERLVRRRSMKVNRRAEDGDLDHEGRREKADEEREKHSVALQIAL
jgi:hypothetical protein